jgi:hypothetical protein
MALMVLSSAYQNVAAIVTTNCPSAINQAISKNKNNRDNTSKSRDNEEGVAPRTKP